MLCRKPLDRVLIAALVLVCGFPVFGQDQQDQGSQIRVGVNLVMVDATVKTKSGEIMENLKKEDFELREDGALQKISIFSRDEMQLNVALVLDLSDSIGPFLGPLRDAATTTLDSLKPDDQVALFTFANNAELRIPLTNDKQKVADMIGTFRARGATNINDGIYVASQYLLAKAPKGRRVIVLISDDVGTDAGGQGTHDIVTETIAADATLYNLKIPGENSPFAGMGVPGLVNIRKVADATGGEIFDVRAVSSLQAVFGALIQRVKTRYTLGYYTTAESGSGKPHKLDVKLKSSFGNRGRDYQVLARNSFFLIPAQPSAQ